MGSPSRGQLDMGLAFDVQLADLLLFVNWLEKVDEALTQGQPLPDAPALGPGAVKGWVHSLRKLDERHWQTQAQYRVLEATLRKQEKPLRSFAANLCENLAALYDQLGLRDKAQAVRMRAAALHIS